jgi:hypothetical protein
MGNRKRINQYQQRKWLDQQIREKEMMKAREKKEKE